MIYSWMLLLSGLNLVIPSFIMFACKNPWKTQKALQKRLGVLKVVLYICIISVIFVPIGVTKLGYAAPELYIIHIIAFLFLMIIHWVISVFVLRGKLSAPTLEIVNAIYFLVSGLLLGERPPHKCFWTMVVFAVMLFLLTVAQLRQFNKKM